MSTLFLGALVSHLSASPGTIIFCINYEADELARTGALLPESFSIDFGMPFNSIKLAIVPIYSVSMKNFAQALGSLGP